MSASIFHRFWHVFWNFIKLYVIAVWTLLRELFTPHNHYDTSEASSNGSVAIVTGGARGIGYEVTRGLVEAGVHVIIGSQYQAEADQAINNIKRDYPEAKIEFLPLDLSSLTAVHQFANAFRKKNLPLNILINNAGIMLSPFKLTEDGFESQFATNYIGHFLLTHLLLDIMKRSGSHDHYARIVNTSSSVHYIGRIHFEDLQGKSAYSPHASYAQSKLAIVLFTYELQRRLLDGGCHVTVNTLHPGVVNTNLYRHVHSSIRWLLQLMAKYLWKTPKQGADTTLYAALSPDLEGQGGLYLDNCHPMTSAKDSYSVHLQRELWYLSLHLTHIDPTE